jgi:hypothetical protein
LLTFDLLQQYRSNTFRQNFKHRLQTKDDAVRYVDERGYIYFWPITGIIFPSLWGAVAGDRPVPNEHDDPGHISWDWKDSLLGKHIWYYGKILRNKATIISLAVAPYFYALSENYGSPEDDYLTIYEQGRMTQEAKAVYEALLDNSPLDTITLRKTAHLASHESESRFNRALSVARHEPALIENARFIGELDARHKLLELYFRSVGAAQYRDVNRLFGWKLPDIEQTIASLVSDQVIKDHQPVDGLSGEWYLLTELL